nr:hypothetical protein [Tanacetum cinerariifolium]
AWLRSVSLLSKKKKLSKRKSVSKLRRKSAKSRPTKDDSDKLDAELDEDMEYMDTKEAMNEGRQSTVDTARPDVSTARPNDDTARPNVSTARQELNIDVSTTTQTTTKIFDDKEMTLADTLIKLKDDKANGVAFKDSKNTDRRARSILTSKPLPTINPKDKGKGVLKEPESAKKMTKSDFDAAHIARDEEIARQLEVELQARYNVDERAKLLAEYFKRRKKQLAEERATTIRNKPPTKNQLRRLMMTYLKKIDFVPIGSEEDERMIRDMNKKAEEESSDKGVDSIKKRKVGSRMKRMSKRHGAKGIYYRIFKSDGSSRWIKTFSEMVTRFDRLDLVELYNLVMQRFETTTPEEDGNEIHMLAKKRYRVTTRTLKRMLALRLIAESASDAAYDLIRFIQKQIDESGGNDRG